MAIYDMDGYQDYDTATLAREYVRVNAPANVSIVTGGRNGGNRLRCYCAGPSESSWGAVVRALPCAVQTLAWGHYITLSNLATAKYLYDVRDATRSHLLFRVETDGSLTVCRAGRTEDWGYWDTYAPTVLGTTAPGLVQATIPFALKALATIDDAAGAVDLYINGVRVLNLTDIDTRNGGTATITNLLHGASSKDAFTAHYEDFWCGSEMLPGDRRVDSHFPIADGANTDWTPSAGADHYAMVDEAVPDDDTTKITTATVDHRDTCKVESFKNTGAAIDAVKVVLTAKKVEPNSAAVAACIRSGGANHDGSVLPITTTWEHVGEVFDADPGTSSAWAEAAFGAAGTAEFGVHKAA